MPHTVHLHRVLRAKPEIVYRAFLEPAALVKWIPPFGFVGTVHSLDAKVGGKMSMSFTQFATGFTHTFGATYTELTPHRLIRYINHFGDPNMPGNVAVTIEIKPVSCGSELTVEQKDLPDAIPNENCHLGWQESLLQLAQLVEAKIGG